MWRFNNINSPREYIRRFSNVATPSTSLDVLSSDVISQVPTVDNVEIIEHSMEMAETMMLGLRLSEGISLEHFANRFGRSLDSVYGEQIQELISLKLLEQRNRALYLTDRGRLLGNEVFLRFF
jgi:oxygen-independent coproporphyrinogen-3 oxidase